ncbi:hypothetical protein CWI36_0685p0050 [Hamiltosporidium magnivora]|uniref:Deoxyribodipyrimidine photo-lyase n=1 Tax=Hamiltosporidium magnivora TaxID=148818 RepID=A0A4Q9LB62_9MICR|nr:hypothetical protein CWI36_0685p0050 [Hamiltosporidium magnivora]
MENRIIEMIENKNTKNILYLMQRDKRIHDNYSVLYSMELGNALSSEYFIGTILDEIKLNERQRTFVIEGLKEIEDECKEYNIYFYLIDKLEEFCAQYNIDCIVTDFSPLKEFDKFYEKLRSLCKKHKYSFYVVDSHNMVPCKLIPTYYKSSKAVKTRLYQKYNQYFKDFDTIKFYTNNDSKRCKEIKNNFPKTTVTNGFKGGYSNGMKEVESFFENRFENYDKYRNKPDYDVLSNLSPWIVSGQISAQKVVWLACHKFSNKNENLDTFLNEIFVWKETAEHFCLYNKDYDNINGALPWAYSTLMVHQEDERNNIYTLEQLERATTHDDLWNAGQKEMLITGKMHGYVRMYWAKQILKWIQDPKKAVETAVQLNDKYSIDGNSPNGYLGVMWCICGSMDYGFAERPIIGKIRPMNAFKAPKYVAKWANKKI